MIGFLLVFVLKKIAQNIFQVFHVPFCCLGIDQDIINIDYHELI
jgi:hypothetical protein